MKAGEKKELGKISVGNILVKGAKEQLNPYELKQQYLKMARLYIKMGKSKEWVIKRLGPLPSAVTWGSI